MSTTIQSIQKLLDSFRENHPRTKKFPKEVWEGIYFLAASHDINRLAEQLQIHQGNLKRRIKKHRPDINIKGNKSLSPLNTPEKIKDDVNFIALPNMKSLPLSHTVLRQTPSMEINIPGGITIRFFGSTSTDHNIGVQ